MIKVVFFDLFYTLVIPKYHDSFNENDVLHLTIDEWERLAEDQELYEQRASGKEKSAIKIIESILEKAGFVVSVSILQQILQLREERFRNCLQHVNPTILKILQQLKDKGYKLGLISNADSIDVKHWHSSPLCPLFDQAFFSYQVGYLKPQRELYQFAISQMNIKAEVCLFVGDGGSNELKGAKDIGMKTILTTFLINRTEQQLSTYKGDADFIIHHFDELLTIL